MLVLLGAVSCASAAPVVKFGIITDVHYADADPEGTRIYRDSLPKVIKATADISAAKVWGHVHTHLCIDICIYMCVFYTCMCTGRFSY